MQFTSKHNSHYIRQRKEKTERERFIKDAQPFKLALQQTWEHKDLNKAFNTSSKMPSPKDEYEKNTH